MRLVTYERAGESRLGALSPEGVVDLAAAVGHPAFPTSMEALIACGGTALDAARAALLDADERARFVVRRPRLLIPLVPRSIRDFFAFEDHARAVFARRGLGLPAAWHDGIAFHRIDPAGATGPGRTILWPPFTSDLDYELEVACVLRGGGVGLDRADAARAIFGYTLMNDWTARDLEREEAAGRLGPAASKDFATSLGPCVVTPDEIDPADLPLEARVDGETWSIGNLGAARWSFPEVIAQLSRTQRLAPCDVLGSGTFLGGCGLDLGRSLMPGSVVELAAPGIGCLTNRVRAAGVRDGRPAG